MKKQLLVTVDRGETRVAILESEGSPSGASGGRGRKKSDDWTPAPAGDGPVPSYREDPVPSSDSTSGKTVSTASQTTDSAPAESDMGVRDAQLVDGDGPDDRQV